MTPAPNSDQPRWTDHDTIEQGQVLLWAGETLPVAEWYWLAENENADDAANVMPPKALAALIQHVRDAAEGPALRARLAELEAELADALDPEEEPYSSTRILEARLAAAEAVIRRTLAGWGGYKDSRGSFWTRYSIHTGDGGVADEPMTPAEVEAIARARGDRS